MKKRPLIASAVLLSISYSCIIAPATGANNGIPVIKAISGQQDVKLNCPILGDKLVFTSVLWLPETEAATVIGAGAAYNHKKYQYLASTGQLWFKVGGWEESQSQSVNQPECVRVIFYNFFHRTT